VLTGIEQVEGPPAPAAAHPATPAEPEPEATLALLIARIDRFFAGSPLREAMEAALTELWPQAGGSA